MKAFETVSFHIVKPCNMACAFCYATFQDMHVGPQLSLVDTMSIIIKLKKAGVEKITFAGGEPMLYMHLDDAIAFAKEVGLTTSIITNGSLITPEWLDGMRPYLDWTGVSVDSTNRNTNVAIGRSARFAMDYYDLAHSIKARGYKLKINTVVCKPNKDEWLGDFIDFAKPDRWKVFQALRVEGQNDNAFESMRVTAEEFSAYLDRHKHLDCLVPEDNAAMTGSYLLVDPLGRLFENSSGKHTYSDPLQDSTMDHCLAQISLDRDMFIKRGGIYKW